MKTYWPVLPVKAAMSFSICAAVKVRNWQTTSNVRSPSSPWGVAASMSPAMTATPAGSGTLVLPRLRMLTLWPASTARCTQGSEIWPVPPMKRMLAMRMRPPGCDGYQSASPRLRSSGSVDGIRPRKAV